MGGAGNALKVPFVVALLGCALGIPVGLAAAGGGDPADEGNVAVESQAAVATDSDVPDAFAKQRDHGRLGLAQIAIAMRKWGDADDAAKLAEIEDLIESLGGVTAGEQAEIDRKLERAHHKDDLSPEEYRQAQAGIKPSTRP